jgi:hypothetical protein
MRRPVPDHVPGVLGVGQDFPDVGVGPAADRGGWVNGQRRGAGFQVGVEPVSDRLVAEPLSDAPGEHPADDWSFHAVGFQARLLHSFGALGWHGMGHAPGAVAVAGLADVEPGLGVDLESAPGFLQDLQDVPLSYALLDPASEYLGGCLALPPVCTEHDRFVGGDQLHPGLLQAVLDLGRDVGTARDSVDGLADHDVEAAAWPLGFGQQVGDPAVAGDRDLELLVSVPVPPVGQIFAAGLNVVEVDDDYRVLGQGVLVRLLASDTSGELGRPDPRREWPRRRCPSDSRPPASMSPR